MFVVVPGHLEQMYPSESFLCVLLSTPCDRITDYMVYLSTDLTIYQHIGEIRQRVSLDRKQCKESEALKKLPDLKICWFSQYLGDL
ncbi:hypothetical protein KUH03_39105 [Sphingobacterium sp. E70]|uniref:hypothetical protein n=1 Tax=Sphingobacterium sp. E70 TaxID=2853439 RepID=UPI00211C1176|nr:hypothetical protein [Sphingobacterium sp. E70]ULT24839.1 hypothetical protein KUH03_39105 [Sphingobacterium sp. E70]